MRLRFPAAARWAVWFLSLAALCGFALTRLDFAQPINTDILSLLPGRSESPALAEAIKRNRNAFTHRMLVLVSGQSAKTTRRAADAAREALLVAGLRASDTGLAVHRALDAYRTHRFALLTHRQIARFQKKGAGALAADVAARLASPAGGAGSIGADPGGYLMRFLADLPRPYPDFLPDGPFLSARRGGTTFYLLRMRVAGAAFARHGSAVAANAVDDARKAARQACSTCEFAATGAPLFANAARLEAKHETKWLTIISTVLIMVLIAFVFRSLAPHVLGFLQLFASVAAAGAAVIAVFGSIQILTLVFGTTLLGIAIDYAFLYFSEYWFGEAAPPNVMKKIRPGLYMGMLTGMVAFAFLAFAGFPALTQIAVFSVVGLFEAGLVVILIFPVTLTRAPVVAAHPAVNWPQRFFQRTTRRSRWRYIIPALAVVAAIPGWWQLNANDDVRELQHFPPRLMHTDYHIRSTLGSMTPSGFFLVQGPNLQTALAREQALFGRIKAGVPNARPVGLSRFLPPLEEQQKSLAAWGNIFGSPDKLRRAFIRMGLPGALTGRLEKAWHSSRRMPLTSREAFKAAPDLERFVIRAGSGVALRATVFSDKPIDPAALQTAAAGVHGARYIVPLDRIAGLFARVRMRATWLVVIGYLLICGVLIWRYGRREALRMVFPPLLAMGVALGLLGWLGVPLNVFVVVALILILGLGRDYMVFLREGGGRDRSPALAVSMSALTTMLSFGLLALSRIPALHAFGLAVLVGILASYLGAPLSLPPRRLDET